MGRYGRHPLCQHPPVSLAVGHQDGGWGALWPDMNSITSVTHTWALVLSPDPQQVPAEPWWVLMGPS